MIKKIINRFKDVYVGNIKYPFSNNNFRSNVNSKISIGSNVKIKNTKVFLSSGSSLFIDDSCNLDRVSLYVDGNVRIGKNNIIGCGKEGVNFRISGSLSIGEFNKINCSIWSRFDSSVIIGDYNNINYGSNLRSDEKIFIGNFNQISYDVMIWDTNTHNIYSHKKRRKLTIDKYPSFGYEYEKPKTKKIEINNDNWIGKNVSILKGTKIADKCIVGYGCVLTSLNVEENVTIVPDLNFKKIKNNV